ncbi:sigma-70 family RNA polymerase sigma factor [Methylobacterium organophilum]|uniref:RNA polymerase sigma factor n=1 Tax=Methylobacterium organophilum TaxID=410 RepID=A0ABQ4T7Y7_METOR|nr:sigma-70 family RNA polymerase sigma factor [Methylobacterium organophilum]GJE26197.1 hypothetical protein LKMONMHP_1044 [Methylobacterium organophilum]
MDGRKRTQPRGEIAETASPASGPGAPRRGRLPQAARDHLGAQLRDLYTAVSDTESQRLTELVARLSAALDALDADARSGFGKELIAALPALRGFALSLAVSAAKADDLVQETMLKAWANREKFQPGTNFLAWLFTILRNHFYSEIRKHRREVEDADGIAASGLIALPDQVDRVELQNVWTNLAKLPASQREALLLVGAHGMTYEDAADLIGCQVGTVKSRVSRARNTLADALGFADGRLSRASV